MKSLAFEVMKQRDEWSNYEYELESVEYLQKYSKILSNRFEKVEFLRKCSYFLQHRSKN